MSGCPVKLDSDEACLIAADWYEEQGDSERAQRMRAVLSFQFGDRAQRKVTSRYQGRCVVVVGRSEDCLHVLAMLDSDQGPFYGHEPFVIPPGELRREPRVGEEVDYRDLGMCYRARVIGHDAPRKDRRTVRIIVRENYGRSLTVLTVPSCRLSRAAEG